MRSLLFQGDFISSEEYTSPSITQSWVFKGENVDPHDDTTLSNRSKGENADLNDVIINLSHNVSEEIAENIRSCQNFLREKLKYFIVQPKEVFKKCLSLLPNSKHEFFPKSYLIPIYYKDKVNMEINKWLEFGIMKRRIVDKKDGYCQKSINANKINDLKSYPSIEKMITECNDILNFKVTQYTVLRCDNETYDTYLILAKALNVIIPCKLRNILYNRVLRQNLKISIKVKKSTK